MKNRVIKTEKDYDKACERIYYLINSYSDAIDPNSPEGEEIEFLSLLVEKYEQEHYQMGGPNPIEAIKFRMDQMNLKQADIAPLFGGKTRISEVLNGRRPLTLKMITLINRYLGIPLESLVNGNREIKLEPDKKEKLLSNPAISAFLTKTKTAMV